MQKRLKKLKGEEEQAKSKGTKKERNEGVSIAYIKTCIQTLYDAKMISVDEAIVTCKFRSNGTPIPKLTERSFRSERYVYSGLNGTASLWWIS